MFASSYSSGRHQLSELKLGWKCEMAAKPVCVTKTVLEYQVCTWWQPLNPPIWSHSCHCRGLVACCCDHGMFGKWACIDKPPCACLMFWTVQDNLQLLCEGSKPLSLSWSFLVQSTLIAFIIEFVCFLCDCFLDLCLVIKQGNYCQVAYFQQQKKKKKTASNCCKVSLGSVHADSVFPSDTFIVENLQPK